MGAELGTLAVNALNAAALIFDTLSDIDNKFGRVLDKECDSLSNDLRKWFKKLAVSPSARYRIIIL